MSEERAGQIRLFVFGLGYSARAVVARMRPRLAAVWGTTRDSAKLAEMAAMGVQPLLFGAGSAHAPDANSDDAITDALAEADYVLVSIPPGAAGDPVLGRYRGALAESKARALVYLSTIGVYGDHAGAWVDERSVCHPASHRSQHRLQAESAWHLFGTETGIPVAIIRLAGIYGPGRGPFEKIRRGTARRVIKTGQVFNRIHVDDIAAIVEAAFTDRGRGVFDAADDEPAPPQDVLAYAAELLGVPAPPEVPYESADLSPMARSFYGENKRVRNRRIKEDLRIRLRYPTYREGLAGVLAAEGRIGLPVEQS